MAKRTPASHADGDEILDPDEFARILNMQIPAPSADGDDQIEKRVRTIAEECHAPFRRTSDAVRRLLKGLPSVQTQPKNWPSSAGVDYAGQILRAAYRALGWEAALEFLDATPLDVLEERVWVTRYLAGIDEYDGLPLFSRKELKQELQAFRKFLCVDRKHLLETGLPSKEFRGSRWLWSRAAKLYVTKRTAGYGPYDSDDKRVRRAGGYYPWVRVLPSKKRLRVIRVPCPYEDADIIKGIRSTEADRLHDLRETILNLKIAVLKAADDFLATSRIDDFWGRCLPLFCERLTANEADFCLRMDRAYTEVPKRWKYTDRSLWWGCGYDGPLNPGGFTSILELIGHLEKESTIGTMHRTREALDDLVVDNDGKRVLGPGLDGDEWVYFDVVNGRDIEKLDSAIDAFRSCVRSEVAFWRKYKKRVSTALETELERDVTVRVRARPHIAELLQLDIQTFAESKKRQFEASGSVQELDPVLSKKEHDQPPCPVQLGNPERREVFVHRRQQFLSSTRYKVIEALAKAFPGKLTQVELIENTHLGDAVNILKRLAGHLPKGARPSPIWDPVIEFPGVPGRGGYGLCFPKS